MSLWKVAWRSMQQRALASGLTAFSMGLGVALIVAVLVIYNVLDQSFQRGAQGYDLIVGAKGAQLPLVLSTVFHLDLNEPLKPIPYSYYEEFTQGRFVPAVDVAIPVCMGHDYKGYPVVATTPEMFDSLRYLGDRKYEFSAGANFESENYFDAVVGATAARQTGLKVGDKFRPVAAGPSGGGHHDDVDFTVTGILAPTGTPNDRAIFTNIEGFFRCPAHQQSASAMQNLLSGPKSAPPGDAKPADAKPGDAKPDDHHEAEKKDAAAPADKQHADKEHAGHDHDEDADHDHEHPIHREVSAILVCTNHDRMKLAMLLPDEINREPTAQAVAPARVIRQFFDNIIGNVEMVLLALAVLVVIVAGVGILVSIYNSMNDRRHEIAIMRALGASRGIVMIVILMESILLSLCGGAFGLLLGHGVIAALGPMIAEQTRVAISAFSFQLSELILVPGLIALAAVVGYLPAIAAYRTDVAKSLNAGG